MDEVVVLIIPLARNFGVLFVIAPGQLCPLELH